MSRHFERQRRAVLAVEWLKGDVRGHIIEQASTKRQFVPFDTVDRR